MTGTAAGDDFYDPESGYRVIWGDSCVSGCPAGAKLRLLTAAVWTAGGSSNVFASRSTHEGGNTWGLTAMDGASAFGEYARPGVHPTTSLVDEGYFVFFLDETGLRRQPLDFNGSTLEWGAATAAGSISDYDGAAVHPVSASQCIVVGYKAPYLWVEYMAYSLGSWAASAGKWYVHLASEEGLRWSDAHWSDAVLNPEDSNEIVIALNLSRWGSAQVITYNIVSGIWSQPKEMFPSQEQWGNMKCTCSGLSVINDRIWAVTVREPWASGDTVMAHHVALMSSPNGQHWRDEDFVTISTMRGKLLYAGGDEYCFVVGNSAVARSSATTKLGYETATQEYQVDETYELSHNISGPSSAPEIVLRAKNAAQAMSDSGLAEVGNDVEVELGTAAQPLGNYAKGVLIKASRERSNVEDEIQLQCAGMMSKLVGSNAYRPAAAKVFDGPYFVDSKFVFEETGNARLTVRQETGKWVCKRYAGLGRHVLHCEAAGMSLLPHAFQRQSFILRTTFMPRVSIEGIYFIFWYEDDENYWQAGVYNNAGTYQLETRRMKDGILSTARVTLTDVGDIAVDTWSTMYLDVRPGRMRLYLNINSASYNYSLPSTYSITDFPFLLEADALIGEFGDLEEFHVGLKVDPFEGWEGAVVSGTADSATYNTLVDNDVVFPINALGQYLRCNDQNRLIIKVDTHTLWIMPSWSKLPGTVEYGIYPEDTMNGPGCYFSELFVCEAIVPYTVDDVVNSMFELAGVSINNAFSGTGIGASGSGVLMNDVDAKYESATDPTALSMWASTDTVTGESACSSIVLHVNPTTCSMTAMVGSGSATPPYQTGAIQAVHPLLVSVPGAGTTKIVRFQANHNFIIISCDGHFLTAFPTWSYWHGGFTGKVSDGTALTTEFRTVLDSFIWDTNEAAGSSLARLMQGRRAKMVERVDGTVAISKFDAPLGNAGTYDVPVVRLLTGEDDTELVSLIEMVGADDRAFYIDMDAARKKLRYVRADNPTLSTQYEALVEAARLTSLAIQRYGSGQVGLYVPDPALELEAEFTVDGVQYIVESITFSISTLTGVRQLQTRISARGYPEGIVVAHYDLGDNYDQGGEYS